MSEDAARSMDDPAVTAQLPEVRVVHGFGLDIEAARTTRVRVDGDGTLVVSRPGGPPLVVAVGAVKQIVWLDGRETATIFAGLWTRLLLRFNRTLSPLAVDGVPIWMASGSCVVLTDEGPVVAWLVDETAPGGGDASHKRQHSGSVALARGLGLVLEPSPPEMDLDRGAVRRSAVRQTRSTSGVRTLESAATVVSLVLAATSWAGFDGADVAVPSVLALGLALPVAAATVVLRRRALRLVTTPPEPDGRTVYRPAGHVAGGLLEIQLGAQDVVIVGGDGSEVWLAGPSAVTGVVQIQVVEDQLRLLDSRDDLLTMLPTARFAPDQLSCEALQSAAATAGITVDLLIPPTGIAEHARISPALASASWQTGDLSPLQVWLMGAVGLFLIIAGFATGQQHEVLGWLVSAGGVVILGIWVWGRWAQHRWARSIARQGAS